MLLSPHRLFQLNHMLAMAPIGWHADGPIGEDLPLSVPQASARQVFDGM